MPDKAELLEEIKQRDDEIKTLKNKAEEFERFNIRQKNAWELKAIYDAYVEVGFTEEQAFVLVQTLFDSIVKQ